VDIAVFTEHLDTSLNAHVGVTVVEYKPGRNFDAYELQAAVYGTNYMTLSNRSIVVVQIDGKKMSELSIRAFGVVPWPKSTLSRQTRHRKTLLFQGTGAYATLCRCWCLVSKDTSIS
jgi:hypothetical protein